MPDGSRAYKRLLGDHVAGRPGELIGPERPTLCLPGGAKAPERPPDLVEELLDFIPPKRINDTIYFNPADTEFFLGFNPLQGTDKSLIAQGVIHSLRALFDETWGASRLQYILNYIARTSRLPARNVSWN
jgi:hypothetical protein